MATGAPIRRMFTARRCRIQVPHDHASFQASSITYPPSTCARSRLPFCQARRLSSTPFRQQETDIERADRPRWQQTPRGMTMPIRLRPKPKNNEWKSNSDPRKLDSMYMRFLGEGGDQILSEEVKWLAVTHKSFDQGRRGFNDRLSYLGKRIVDLQTSMALVSSPRNPMAAQGPDEYGRVPFEHPALEGLTNLSERAKSEILHKSRLAQLGQSYGVDEVMRWKPKKADNLLGSGLEIITAQAIYAIIGAVSLERGGEVANRIVKERILSPLGIL